MKFEIELTDKNTLKISSECNNKEFIERIMEGMENIVLDYEEWRSKYNSYVVFDYEPFCSDGFIYSAFYKGEENFVKFAKLCIRKTFQTIKHLETCYNKEPAKVKQ